MGVKVWIGGSSGNETAWGTAANWSPSGVPTNSDDVYIDGGQSTYSIDTNLDQAAVALDSLHVLDNYTGTIGTATAPLEIAATDVFLHESSGSSTTTGSTRINLDLGSTQAAINVFGSASSTADVGLPPIRVIGTNAHNEAFISGPARIGFAAGDASEAATVKTVACSPNSAGQGPTVTLGNGCTLSTVEIAAGTVTNRGANVTTLTIDGGFYTAFDAATHTTINLWGGEVEYRSEGTITTANVGGILDLSQDSRPKTITNTNLYSGATLNANTGNPLSVTFTNGIDLVGCAIQDVTLITGKNLTVPDLTSI